MWSFIPLSLAWLEESAVGTCYLILFSRQHNEISILSLLERWETGAREFVQFSQPTGSEARPFVFPTCHLPRNKWVSPATFPKTWNNGTLDPCLDPWEKNISLESLESDTCPVYLHLEGLKRARKHIDGSDKSSQNRTWWDFEPLLFPECAWTENSLVCLATSLMPYIPWWQGFSSWKDEKPDCLAIPIVGIDVL